MFRLVDRLVYRELFWPWVFGVAMFTVVLLAGTYLFRLTTYFVEGIDIGTIMALSALYMPGLIAKTFPMAVLLASLLAFARLSGDSELIAIQAAGGGLLRIMLPVAVFGIGVALLAFAFGEYVVPRASLQSVVIQARVLKQLSERTDQFYKPLYVEGDLKGAIFAKDVDFGTGTMTDVVGVWYDDGEDDGGELLYRFGELFFSESEEWVVREGRLITISPDGTIYVTDLQELRPPREMVLDFRPEEIIASKLRDTDSFSMVELKQQIDALRQNPRQSQDKIRTLEVGFWSKVSIPLSGFVFALVGAPVAIRRVRQPVGVGVAVSIVVIFVYYMLLNYLTILAKGGQMAPVVSAFLPVAIGLFLAGFLVRQKNR